MNLLKELEQGKADQGIDANSGDVTRYPEPAVVQESGRDLTAAEAFAAVTLGASPTGTNALVFLHDDALGEMQDTVSRHPALYPTTWLYG